MGNTRKIETTLSDHHNRLQNKPDQLQDKYEHNQHTTCTNARGLAEQHAEMLGGHTNCFFRSGMGMSGQLSRETEKHPNGDRPTTERTTTHERSRHRQSRSSKHLANPSRDTGREPQSETPSIRNMSNSPPFTKMVGWVGQKEILRGPRRSSRTQNGHGAPWLID